MNLVMQTHESDKEDEEKKGCAIPLKGLPDGGIGKEWGPACEPQAALPGEKSV